MTNVVAARDLRGAAPVTPDRRAGGAGSPSSVDATLPVA